MALHSIVVAAGRGKRAGKTPKQFAALCGRAVLWHALRPFAANAKINSVRLVVMKNEVATATECAKELPREIEIVAAGGETRAASVLGGLQGIADDDWAVVHDAARPCLTDSLLEKFLSAAEKDKVGALLALPLADSLKESDNNARAINTLSREKKYLAQTPQMFRAGALRKFLSADCEDEADAMTRAGFSPLLIKGDSQNIKITRAEDFAVAAAILSARSGSEQ